MAKKIRNWLSKRRTELGLSQDDIATELQKEGFTFTRSTISGWENNKYFPPLQLPAFRKSLANALEWSVSELLRNAGYEVDEFREKAIRDFLNLGINSYISNNKGYSSNQEVVTDVRLLLINTDTLIITDHKILRKIRDLALHSMLPPKMRVKMIINIELVSDDEDEDEDATE